MKEKGVHFFVIFKEKGHIQRKKLFAVFKGSLRRIQRKIEFFDSY